MEILKEKPTGMGGKWQLIRIKDFYEFGTEKEINSFLGCSVDNCGTKEEVIKRLKSLKELSKELITQYIDKGFDELLKSEEFYFDMVCSFLDTLENLI